MTDTSYIIPVHLTKREIYEAAKAKIEPHLHCELACIVARSFPEGCTVNVVFDFTQPTIH